MKIGIFLDDHRMPGEVTWLRLPKDCNHWLVVRTYDQFVGLLEDWALNQHIEIDYVSFDHDLGLGHGIPDKDCPDGLDCAKALVEWCMNWGKKLPDFVVHSLNPVGAENIRSYLESYRRHQNDK
jgi:hypothetical protein